VTSARRYALFGLQLVSELELPGFPEAQGRAQCVTIRFAPVPPPPEGQVGAQDGALLLDVPGVGRFRIAGGEEILIEPASGASERNLRVYLLGSAMGALLHQRGALPLHANAIEIGGRAVAFLGRSGAGKSTLAAWFADRGHRILCDDVCAVSLEDGGRPMVEPGVPRLRLWDDALVRAGRDSADYERSFDGQEKFDVPAAAASAVDRPLPLAACYVLGEPGGGDKRGIERLAGAAAVDALVANTYRGRFATMLGLTERHLRLCLGVAASVPVHSAARRWGSDCFEEEAARLAQHAAEIIK
jgi:hypothetical protein